MNANDFCYWLSGILEGMKGSRSSIPKDTVDLMRVRLDSVADGCYREQPPGTGYQQHAYIPLPGDAVKNYIECCAAADDPLEA
jgi:hypothetical protein